AIDFHFSKPTLKAVFASLDSDESEWAKKVAASMRKKSPISLHVTFRQIREGKNLSFEDCMNMEFRLACRAVVSNDFFEGVRAVIVDKDNMPRWHPASIEDVVEKDVDAYFANLGKEELSLS